MNLFGMMPKKQKGPLAGLLQQQEQEQQPQSLMDLVMPPFNSPQKVPAPPGGGYERKFTPIEGAQPQAMPLGSILAKEGTPSPIDAKDYPNYEGPGHSGRLEKAPNSPLWDMMNTPMGAGGDKPRTPFSGWTVTDFALKGNPLTIPGTLIAEKLMEPGTLEKVGKFAGDVINKPVSDLFSSDPKPTATPKAEAASASVEESPQPPSDLDVYMSNQFQSTPKNAKNDELGFMNDAIGATQELLKIHGKNAQTLEGAKAALKQEFQDTPELDAIIARTEQELAQTKANRKQPGIGDFLVMALLNLGGMNPRNSADMVLGLGDQKRDEMRLEDRLAQLEGSRAGAKMQGRQSLRAMEHQDKYRNLEAQMRQQEAQRKQFNEDRDFKFKSNSQGVNLLRQMAGQEGQILGSSLDEKTRKAATEQRAKLKKALGLDDAGLNRLIQQQQQRQQPQDERQSRMFGDLIAGGGYA